MLMPEKRYELLDGELTMVPAPNRTHQRILLRLGRELARASEQHGAGECSSRPSTSCCRTPTSYSPTCCSYRGEREDRSTEENVRGAPDLVVEILSPSTADLDVGYKHELYGRHGVLEYWVVDPAAEPVAVHRQRGGKLEPAGTFGRGERLATAVLEGLALDLDELFR